MPPFSLPVPQVQDIKKRQYSGSNIWLSMYIIGYNAAASQKIRAMILILSCRVETVLEEQAMKDEAGHDGRDQIVPPPGLPQKSM